MLWEHEPQAFSSSIKTITSVSITREKHGEHVFLLENTATKTRKQLVNFDYKNVNPLCSCHHYVNSAC